MRPPTRRGDGGPTNGGMMDIGFVVARPLLLFALSTPNTRDSSPLRTIG